MPIAFPLLAAVTSSNLSQKRKAGQVCKCLSAGVYQAQYP